MGCLAFALMTEEGLSDISDRPSGNQQMNGFDYFAM